MSNNTVDIRSQVYPSCAAEFRVSGIESHAGIPLCVSTGAMSMQTYATRAELRALGEMLLRHANENELLEVAA